MKEIEADSSLQFSNNDQQRIYSRRLLYLILTVIILNIVLASQNYYQKRSFVQFVHFENISRQFILFNQTNDFDVVLSYYAEDVNYVARFIQYLRNSSTLQKLKYRIIVYNKNFKINNTYLQTVLKADLVYHIANVGREGQTYLYHIINNYSRLAKHIFFCQAGIEGITDKGFEEWLANRLDKQFNALVGYMPMVAKHWFAKFDCGERPGESMQRLAELWGVLEQTLCPPRGQFVAFRGQFIVSAKRIRFRPLRIYQYLDDLLRANETHWIHSDTRSKHYVQSASVENPHFGHIVERIWTTLFQCTDPSIIERCDRNECACFD